MKSSVTLGLVGDYSPDVKAHLAIPKALALAASVVGCEVEVRWLPTSVVERNVEGQLEECDGLWCVPGSPYVSMEGALKAIRFARERTRPFLGTCGGFQHAVIEYARNVLGIGAADHAESNPAAPVAFVNRLACSLANVSGSIRVLPGTRAFAIIGQAEIVEQYNCNFGVNPECRSVLESGGLRISGVDREEGVRIVELPEHPFFVATLFQPELSAVSGLAHPLVVALVSATSRAQTGRRSAKS